MEPPRLDLVTECTSCDQVGRSQIEAHELVEIVDGSLMKSKAHRETTNQIYHARQRRFRIGRGRLDDGFDRGFLEEVGFDEVQMWMFRKVVDFLVHYPWDDDTLDPLLLPLPAGACFHRRGSRAQINQTCSLRAWYITSAHPG